MMRVMMAMMMMKSEEALARNHKGAHFIENQRKKKKIVEALTRLAILCLSVVH